MILLAFLLVASDVVLPVPVECGSPQGCGSVGTGRFVPLVTEPSRSTPISVLVEAVPMDWARAALGTKGTPAVGYWKLSFYGATKKEIPWELVNIAIAKWATQHGVPKPVFLSEAEAFPVILRTAGGNWRVAQRIVKYVGLGVGMTVFPPAAGADTVMQLLTEGVEARIPDVSRLKADLPRVITIPESGGVTVSLWSAKIPPARKGKRPVQNIGPFEVYPK